MEFIKERALSPIIRFRGLFALQNETILVSAHWQFLVSNPVSLETLFNCLGGAYPQALVLYSNLAESAKGVLPSCIHHIMSPPHCFCNQAYQLINHQSQLEEDTTSISTQFQHINTAYTFQVLWFYDQLTFINVTSTSHFYVNEKPPNISVGIWRLLRKASILWNERKDKSYILVSVERHGCSSPAVDAP